MSAEFIRTPSFEALIFCETGHFVGDCDDAATLAAALLEDWPCRFVALRLPGDIEYSHVWLECAGKPIDPIVPASALPIRAPGERMILDL